MHHLMHIYEGDQLVSDLRRFLLNFKLYKAICTRDRLIWRYFMSVCISLRVFSCLFDVKCDLLIYEAYFIKQYHLILQTIDFRALNILHNLVKWKNR